MQEEALTSLLLHADIFFHHRLLQKNLLTQEIIQLLASLADLLVAAADLRLPDPTNRDTSGLTSALKKLDVEVDDPLSSDAIAFVSEDLKKYLKGSGLSSNKDTAAASARSRSEARADMVAPLRAARESAVAIIRTLEEFPSSADWYNLNTLQRAVGPNVVNRARSLLESHRRKVELGADLVDRQNEMIRVLSVPATMRALRSARHPMDPVMVPGLYPRGSALEVRALAPVVPAAVQGTRQPDAMPLDATLIYTPNGEGERTVTLVGSGQHRLEAGIPGETYVVTEGAVLVTIGGALQELPLTSGTRTAAEVLSELDAGMAAHGGSAVQSLGKLMLLHADEMSIVDAGQVPRDVTLRATGAFPMALEALTLHVDVWGLDPFGVLVPQPCIHIFGPSPHGIGNPYQTMQEVVDELLTDPLFIGPFLLPAPFTMTVADDGGDLVLTAPGIAPPASSMAVETTISTSVPFPLSFAVNPDVGWELYTTTDLSALGFTSLQKSTDYYSLEAVVALVEEEEGDTPEVAVGVEQVDVWEGEGYFTDTLPGIQWVPTTPTAAQPGDILSVPTLGTYLVAPSTGLLPFEVVALHSGQTPLLLVFEGASIQRSLLDMASTDTSLDSLVVIGAGTANTQLGLAEDTYFPQAAQFEVFGRLSTERRRSVRDLACLQVQVGASLEVGELSSPISAVASDRLSFTSGPLFLEGLSEARVLSALATGFDSLTTSLRALQLRPRWKWVTDLNGALQRLEDATQGAPSTHQLLSAMASMYSASQQLGNLPGAEPLAALQRVGVIVQTPPADTLHSLLDAWTPQLPPETLTRGEALLSALDERGYDRFRSFLIRGRYHDAAAISYEGASSASSVESRLTRLAQFFRSPRGSISSSHWNELRG